MSEYVAVKREVLDALVREAFVSVRTGLPSELLEVAVLNARAALAAGEARPVGEVVDLDPDDENGACEAIVQLHQEVRVGDLLYAAPQGDAQ